QSHYYLEFLLTFLLTWLPAARTHSLDAWRARRRGAEEPATVPFWPIFLLRGQLLIAYFYAGVAKLNWDWLGAAVPVRWYLADPGVLRPYEPFLSPRQVEVIKGFLQSNGFAYFISYTGLIFDLTVGFLFLFPLVGAGLGWKLKASPEPVAKNGKQAVGTKVATLILVWLGLHALIPLRHYAIAGDGRFTYEGMSFSWRLKTEFKRGRPHEIF